MKKISRILSFILPLFVIFTFFIPFDPTIWDYIKEFSFDKEIKSDTKESYKSLFEMGRIALLILSCLPILYFLFFEKLCNFLNVLIEFLKNKTKVLNNHLSLNFIFFIAVIFAISFMIGAVFLFDIGQDPAYYLNDIQNIEKYGQITRDYDIGGTHIYLIPNLPFNILSYFYVKFFGFSVIGIRFIIILFSLLFIYSLYLFLEKDVFKYSFILIFAIPGIYTLTSEVFLELTSISFILLSIFYLDKYEHQGKKKFEYLSLFFVAIAFTTKFQLIVYFFLVFAGMILYETEIHRKKFLLFFLIKTYLLIFFLVIITILPFGFNEMLIYLNWYFISNTAEGREFLTTSDIKLFMVNEIIFGPMLVLVIYLYYKYSNDLKKLLSVQFLILFSLINVGYWLLFFSSVTWRNIIYADIFVCIMLATVLVYKRNYAKLILSTFFIIGIFTNFMFLNHGVIDDVQFLREHFKAIVFERDTSQKTFFAATSKIVEPDANVYVPALPYLSRVYLNNRRIILLQDFENTSSSKSYLIFDKNAFEEKYFIQVKEKEDRGDYKPILKVGDYYLFEILSQ